MTGPRLIIWVVLIGIQNCLGIIINNKVLRNQTSIGKHGREVKMSYISMKKIENKLLQVVPIGGSMVYNSIECRKNCALTLNCIALNLRPTFPPSDQLICFLLDKDHYKRPHLLVDSEGAEYHVVTVRLNKHEISLLINDNNSVMSRE